MEIEEINHRSCKRSRVVGNGKLEPRENHEDEDDGETIGEINNINNNNNTASASNSNNSRMIRPWHHPSSRIIRVSRATGGKDRHSKVITAKGLRDRRIRLSVSTAIQFYDLQDRLEYDQPSKAIEWLIKAAASAIAELPSLDTNFPEPQMDHHHHQHLNIEQPMPSDSGMDPDADPSYNQQQHSSTSETSKGSVLTLSRSESRVRARERAKERVMDKKKDRDDAHVVSHHQNVADPSLDSQGSFTKLLTGGSSSAAAVTVTAGQASSSTANFIQKHMQQNLPPVTSTADYFGTQSSLFGQQPPQQKTATIHQISTSGFSSQAHFGNSSPIGMVPLISGNASDGHPGEEMQQFAFLQEHFFPVAAAAAAASVGDYNLNFSISPSLVGFHRGTLQSNSPAHHHQHHQHQFSHNHHHNHQQVQAQRLSSALDGSSVPFFFSTAATAAAASPAENPYASGFDGHLQLCDGYKHHELKGKGKG